MEDIKSQKVTIGNNHQLEQRGIEYKRDKSVKRVQGAKVALVVKGKEAKVVKLAKGEGSSIRGKKN